MSAPIPMTGRVFSRLTVVGDAGQRRGRRLYWLARCSCGTEKLVDGAHLREGATASCGCLSRELAAINGPKNGQIGARKLLRHGHARASLVSPEYVAWGAMRRRCCNTTDHAFPHYGGRGIFVCERWGSFDLFLADMGPRPSADHSIDRIDVNGNYEPSNCRWATRTEQNRNRRDNHVLTVGSETRCLAEWEQVSGIQQTTIRARIRRGWSPQDAVAWKPWGMR